MRANFNRNRIWFFLTLGLFFFTILVAWVLKYDSSLGPWMTFMFYSALLIEVYLGWIYIKHYKILYSTTIVACGMAALCGSIAVDTPIVFGFFFFLFPAFACSIFLHSSLVLLLRKSDYWLYVSQVFCVAAMVYGFYWLVQIAAFC